jgi:pimeloyl-ACP methyl ester carboxylesterase
LTIPTPWRTTIDALTDAGYRVIAPDQIGFCKSTKPERYQYSFQQLALNTHALLGSLGIKTAALVAPSTGGMIAIRYALMYPKEIEHLVLVDPIGLEDWKAKGVPPISVDDWYGRELKTNADGIRRYEQDNTAIGKDFAPPAVQATLGHYPEIAKAAATRIRGAKLVESSELGHAPQIQDPAAFHKVLLGCLAAP